MADASKGAPRSSRTPHPQTQILFRRIAMPILLVVREVHAEVMAGAIAVASMYSISRFISMSARILSSIDMASMRAGPSRRRRPRASWIERAPGSRSRRRRRVVVVWRGAGIKVAHRRVWKPCDIHTSRREVVCCSTICDMEGGSMIELPRFISLCTKFECNFNICYKGIIPIV